MNIALRQSTPEQSDGIAHYKVVFDPCQVSELVEYIKSRTDEWGGLSILSADKIESVQYSHGSFQQDISDETMNATILTIKASGGYTNMDYTITI